MGLKMAEFPVDPIVSKLLLMSGQFEVSILHTTKKNEPSTNGTISFIHLNHDGWLRKESNKNVIVCLDYF